MVSFGTWMMTVKAVLISTGVVAVAILLKASIPVALDFSISRAPILWNSLLSWLKPPYLYVITNGIIITIAASSRFYKSSGHSENGEDDAIISGGGKFQTEHIFRQAPPQPLVVMNVDSTADFGFEAVLLPSRVDDAAEDSSAAAVVYAADKLSYAAEKSSAAVADYDNDEEEEEKRVVVEYSDLVADDGDQFVVPTPTPTLMDSPDIKSENLPPADKPLVSARFGHRKTVKSSSEGGGARALRVAKPKRHETLENTWRMITEGKSMPLTRHFKKCDTWQNNDREISNASAAGEFKKSETFRDRTNYYESPVKAKTPSRLRKEPSLSQDELNRRVEAFIKKINEDMRLQRLESLKQYKEMVSHGT